MLHLLISTYLSIHNSVRCSGYVGLQLISIYLSIHDTVGCSGYVGGLVDDTGRLPAQFEGH